MIMPGRQNTNKQVKEEFMRTTVSLFVYPKHSHVPTTEVNAC